MHNHMMSASEALFFRNEPVAHIVAWQERQRIARRQVEFRDAYRVAARHDPRWASACA